MKQRHTEAACLTFLFVHCAKTLSTQRRVDGKVFLPFVGLGIALEHLLGEAAHGSSMLSHG